MRCTVLSAEKTTNIYDRELQELGVTQAVLLKGENVSAIFRILKTFRRYKEYIRANPCDIIYLNLTNAVTMRYAKIAAEEGIKKRIVHSHASGIQPGKSYVIKKIAHNISKKFFIKYVTECWTCSEQAALFLFDPCSKKEIESIPNAIEIEKFRFDIEKRKIMRNKLGIENEDVKIIGNVGRLTAEKNQIFLLKVFAKVHQKNPNTKLLLIGDGPLRNMLEQYAKEIGIFESCFFYGFTEDTAPFYSAIDLFCLPSIVEGFGIVALEAQAAGCPCLLSNNVSEQIKATSDCDVKFLPLEQEVWEIELIEQLEKTTRNRVDVHIDSQYDIGTAAVFTQGKFF